MEKIAKNFKETEGVMKKAEFDLMLDLKSLVATDPELNRAKTARRRDNKDHAAESYQQVYERTSPR